MDRGALKYDDAFLALLEVVSQRAFLILDEVLVDKESACVELIRIGSEEVDKNQKQIENHSNHRVALAEVFVLRIFLIGEDFSIKIFVVLQIKVITCQIQRSVKKRKTCDFGKCELCINGK